MSAEEDWQSHYLRLCSIKECDFSDNERYTVTFQLVNAADYGISQRRERVLISAFRCDLGIEPLYLNPTHSKEALFVDQWITGDYWERYDISPNDYLGLNDKKILDKLRNKSFPIANGLPWCTVRDVIHDLPKPVDRGVEEEIPNHIQHPGAREYVGHYASIFDYPSRVLKAGTHGTPGGENMVRVPDENIVRYFTTREAARLQTFPDDWRFHGTWGACIKQLGNAVPVELIKIFATEINQRLVEALK
jgi:DNA (cytosine-5)-methyltransferase 1